MLAVDPSGIASDLKFPAPAGHAHQLALLLVGELVVVDPDGTRRPSRLIAAELRRAVDAVLDWFPAWAGPAGRRADPTGWGRRAVDPLVAFGLARWDGEGGVVARPSLARYRSAPVVVSGPPTLLEDLP